VLQGQSLLGLPREGYRPRILCAGNPDTVYKQIMTSNDQVGGSAMLIFIGRSGFLITRSREKASA